MTVCFAFCKLCDISGLDKFEVVNYFSSLGDGYDGEGPVRRMVDGYQYEFPAENPLSYLLYVHLPKDSETKKNFFEKHQDAILLFGLYEVHRGLPSKGGLRVLQLGVACGGPPRRPAILFTRQGSERDRPLGNLRRQRALPA